MTDKMIAAELIELRGLYTHQQEQIDELMKQHEVLRKAVRNHSEKQSLTLLWPKGLGKCVRRK